MQKHYLSLKYYILALLTLASFTASAQNYKCAADEVHKEMLQKNASYRKATADFDSLMRTDVASKYRTAAGTIYRIPVVVHVMHKGEAVGAGSNISDAAIQDCIKRLNQIYRKVAGTKGGTNASATDIGIEFALAVRDPNGNCTNGINRVDMTSNATYMASGVYRSSAGITDTELKATPNARWDQTKYYNIWVVYEIDNNENGYGIQGYAYFASSHGQSYDGAVMIDRAITDTSSITLPHELGHSLNLYHTFEGDNNGASCPANADCTKDGDQVCDTPPHIRSSDCSVGTNSCDGGSSTDLFRHNYMDYSADACQNMFSAGQKPRMVTAMTVTRKSFLASQGNMSLVPVSKAGVDFVADVVLGCTGTVINFIDKSTCNPNVYITSDPFPNITFAWTVTNNAGTTLTSTLQNPQFTFTVVGEYDVTLSVTNAIGTATKTVTKMIVIAAPTIAATCKPVSTNTANQGYGIFAVKLGDINHTSGSTIDDMASGFTDKNGYADLTCTESTILNANTSYTLKVLGSYSSGLIESIGAYIDYNNDGDFNDVGDTVKTWIAQPGSANYSVVTFTTPSVPVIGKSLRMRIVECRSTETLGPCMTTTRGQCHDFAVYFKSISTCIVPSTPKITAAKNPLCTGDNLTLTASGPTVGVTYTWVKPSASTATVAANVVSKIGVAATEAGSYYVTSTLNGCNSAAAVSNVVVNTTPAVPTIAGTATLCTGNNLSLTASTTTPGVTYAWTKPANSTATASAGVMSKTGVVANDAGAYSVTATANGCISASSAPTTVVVNTLPAQPSSITGVTTPCPGTQSYYVTAVSGVTFTWVLSGGGSIAPTSANSSITAVTWYAAGGPFSLAVTPGNSCGNGPKTSINVNVGVCTGNVDAILPDVVHIWLNQSSDNEGLTLNISEGTLDQYFSKVSIYSTNGVEVLSSSLNEPLQTNLLYVNSLQPGVYQVLVYSNTDKAPVLLRFVK